VIKIAKTEELKQKLADVESGKMSRKDFLLYALEHEKDIIDGAESKLDKKIAKKSLKAARKILGVK
jgi:hypothetical protein